ncbi:MAG: hypothetical protein N0E59_21225 [Candidatus Thiodiazotropha taylori]|nr:hypothetical protein [Candidatus Thiodiazotropha taylori]MCW4250754.1 hypothetical protein [Candidatus Thiodiazotropha endolucinida]MCG8073711.1 hypothetical protein [Candidatus Thiodiazotropha taylori]MCG8113281.1 hypothetical protein [Candidatus Thiodiazotropha taylori]MCW4285642.1 hypothetical protein [Candidatus Thiodiazotropha taylori]
MAIDWHRIGFFMGASGVSAAAGWFGQPLIHGNTEAVGVIVNVFSILAGFLVTIMTLLGEPSLFRGRTWRADAVRRSNVYRRLIRHKWLFIAYLLVLGLVFATTLITKKYPEHDAVIWLERVYLSLAALAFIMSLVLPSRLMNLQLARFDELVESRRKGDQNDSENTGS